MPLTTAETAFAYAMQGNHDIRNLEQRCENLEKRLAQIERQLDESAKARLYQLIAEHDFECDQ